MQKLSCVLLCLGNAALVQLMGWVKMPKIPVQDARYKEFPKEKEMSHTLGTRLLIQL